MCDDDFWWTAVILERSAAEKIAGDVEDGIRLHPRASAHSLRMEPIDRGESVVLPFLGAQVAIEVVVERLGDGFLEISWIRHDGRWAPWSVNPRFP